MYYMPQQHFRYWPLKACTQVIRRLSGDFLALLLLALSSFTMAYLLHRYRTQLRAAEPVMASLGLGLGILWWCVAGISELSAHISAQHHLAAIMVLAALSAQLMMRLGQSLNWPALARAVMALVPFMAPVCPAKRSSAAAMCIHPTAGACWPLALRWQRPINACAAKKRWI